MTKYKSGVDFAESVIAILPNSATDPSTPVEGQIYFNTTSKVTFYYNGTAWITTAALNSIILKGVISNANTNPNYPAGVTGDTYFITTNAGRIGGVSGKVVEIGDMLICQTANAGGNEASVGTFWFVVQTNVVAASETTQGIIEIATQGEVTTGTDDLRAITPLKYVTDRNSNKCTAPTITGDNTTTVFVVNHTAGIDNICQVRDSSENLVIVDILFGATSNTITFAVAPGIGITYKVVIK